MDQRSPQELLAAWLAGEIDPEHVVTPGIFVNGVVEIPDPQQEEVLIRAGVAYA